MKKIGKVIKTIFNVLITMFVLLFLLVVCLQRFSNNQITFLGYRMFSVASSSMAPDYQVGDVLIVKITEPEDIKVGDEVYSYNEETNKKELKKVKRIFRNKTNEWLHLTIKIKDKEEEIVCTKNHRIYINNKGWIEAKDILENDEVLLYNNIIGTVIKKELQILDH